LFKLPEMSNFTSPPSEMGVYHLNYTVCSTQYLKSELTNEDTSELNQAEMSQINYWQPKSKGELLFNFWD